MYPTHLLSTLFRFVALLAVMPVRVLFIPAHFQNLVLMTYYYVSTWQFVNADTSRVHHLRFQPHGVTPKVVLGVFPVWKAVGCYTSVVVQPLQLARRSII
jgi:hypothetical protein